MSERDLDSVVRVRAADRKLHIELHRPRSMNAQNQAMRRAIVLAIARLEEDPELAVGIISGAGGRAFSAGADLAEVKGPIDGPRPRPGHEGGSEDWAHFEAVRWASKPLIAAIDGHCLGGGLELANYCDVRIATESSWFGQPEPRTVGGTGGPALHQLPRQLPLGEALLMQLTSQPMAARRAYELGLVQRIYPDRDAMMAGAEAIADQMIECDGEALRVIKRVVKWGSDMTAEQAEKLRLLAAEAVWAERARAERAAREEGR